MPHKEKLMEHTQKGGIAKFVLLVLFAAAMFAIILQRADGAGRDTADAGVDAG